MRILSLILILLLVSFSYASDVDDLVLQLPEVKKAHHELSAAYYDLKATYSQFGLNVDSFYRYSYNQPTVTVGLGPTRIRVSNDYNYNYGIQFNWLLYTFGVLENQIKSKELIYYSKVLKYRQTVNDSYLKFYQLLYDFTKSCNLLDFSNNTLKYSEEFLNTSKRLYDVGIAPKVDYLRALSVYQDSLTQNSAAYQNYIITTQNLYSFLFPNSNNYFLPNFVKKYIYYIDSDVIPKLPNEYKNPEELVVSQILYSNIISLLYQRRAVLAQSNPKLALSSQYVRQRPSGFSRDYSFNIILSLSWKIFDSGLVKNQAQSVEEQANALYQDYLRTIVNLYNSQRNVKSKYHIDYKMYKSYLYNLDFRKESFRLVKLKYENGLSSYLDYLDAQNSLLQTILNIKNSKNDLFWDLINYSYLNDLNITTRKISELIERKINGEKK